MIAHKTATLSFLSVSILGAGTRTAMQLHHRVSVNIDFSPTVAPQYVQLILPCTPIVIAVSSTFNQLLNQCTDCLLTAVFGTTDVGLPHPSHRLGDQALC